VFAQKLTTSRYSGMSSANSEARGPTTSMLTDDPIPGFLDRSGVRLRRRPDGTVHHHAVLGYPWCSLLVRHRREGNVPRRRSFKGCHLVRCPHAHGDRAIRGADAEFVTLAFGQRVRTAGIPQSMEAAAIALTMPSPRASSRGSRTSSVVPDRPDGALRGLRVHRCLLQPPNAATAPSATASPWRRRPRTR
jgi:hypothetical protein